MGLLDTREELIDLKLKKLAALEQKQKYREELPHVFGHKKYKWQQEFCDAKFTHRKRFICAANQIGKVQPNDELILTPRGYKKNGDIVKGDYVYGSDGKQTKVLAVFPHKDWEFHKVTFDDGSYTFCGLEHKWLTTSGKVMDTQEVKNFLPYGVSINYCKDVQFPEGDFKSRAIEYYDSAKFDFFNKSKIVRIPERVLLGNVERRIGFLNGVMDRDGKCIPSKNGGSISFSSKHHPAIDDFVKLVTSLGGWASQKGHVLFLGLYHHELFHASGNNWKVWHKRRETVNVKTFKSIEFYEVADGQCMTVDNENSTYLTSKFNIVTHNSSIQIRDVIDIATKPEIWEELWPVLKTNIGAVPYGWYLYPNQDTVMQEFETKWVKEILPRGKMESHPLYGWKAHIQTKVLKHIDFNSGFRLYFKTYNQNVMDLQSGTVWLIALDEEVKEALLPELEARLFATGGMMSMAFTATIGQDIWRRTIERIGKNDEQFPKAWKAQVSMYDCLEYVDGSDTPWTRQKINIAVQSCKNDAEIARRIHGKFVLDTGLLYTGFNRRRNFKPYPVKKNGTIFHGVPKGWDLYSAVDYGSGGQCGHSSAVIFLAVNKTFTKIRAIKVKRFDSYGDMTAGDLYKEYVKMRREIGVVPVKQVYDGAAKDFGTIATRSGDSFFRANKDHEEGELALNSALKTGIFVIYDDDEDEGDKLCRELESLTVGYNKKTTTDDLTDVARYGIVAIPINWHDVLAGKTEKKDNKSGEVYDDRPENGKFMSKKDEETSDLHYQDEFSYWN
ncbi:MAG: Hint domain-containing protein, partial [Nanoarchaeota archaeon]|nr:Hint domain-containing protein [Nanoarchaeota archaeon]